MSAYLITSYKVTDPEKLGAYHQAVIPTIMAHGGKVLVAGPPATVVEGTFKDDVVVVLEFPSMDVLREWYDSEEYQKIKHLRHDSTNGEWTTFSEQFVIPQPG